MTENQAKKFMSKLACTNEHYVQNQAACFQTLHSMVELCYNIVKGTECFVWL